MKRILIKIIGTVVFLAARVLTNFSVFFFIYSDMFGHQAWNIEYYLRKLRTKGYSNPLLIGVQNSSYIPNSYLFKRHKDYGIIIFPPTGIFATLIKIGITKQKLIIGGRDLNNLPKNPFLLTTMVDLHIDPSTECDDFIAIPLTTYETDISGQALKNYGLTPNNYFCFLDRNISYKITKHDLLEKKKLSNNFLVRELGDHGGVNIIDDYRNTNLVDYYMACDLLNTAGLVPVRVGSGSNIQSDRESIIDYSSIKRTNRSDFDDIALISQCKFFVGPNSGVWLLARSFNKPVCLLNIFVWPWLNVPMHKNSIYLPKKLWALQEKRFLTISEMVSMESKYHWKELLDPGFISTKLNLEVVDNSEEEVAASMIEMHQILEGSWDTQRDIYPNYLNSTNKAFYSKAKLSTTFLELNPSLVT